MLPLGTGFKQSTPGPVHADLANMFRDHALCWVMRVLSAELHEIMTDNLIVLCMAQQEAECLVHLLCH